jgi:hypothetical protein
MWFTNLVGFEEVSPENVRDKISIDGKHIISKVNGKSFQYGSLEIASLEELEEQASLETNEGRVRIQEIVGNVQELHCDPQNKNALFQAASQFNLLEMTGPHITPERGVDIYERDLTQGPACAIACGAGTIYRNYFVPVKNQIGQSSTNQIDCLKLIGKELGNNELLLWKMTNGYAMANQIGLLHIKHQINNLSKNQRERLKKKLRVGIQWNTEVTINDSRQLVSQVYCSALPVAYSNVDSIYWESFARLILEATYEATLCSALINLERTGCNKVFLTLVGGGAFGNENNWILESLEMAISKFRYSPLEIRIVSYGSSNKNVHELIKKINR